MPASHDAPRRSALGQLIAAGCAIALLATACGSTPAPSASGKARTSRSGATGWFSLARVNGHWTLIDPSGKPFWLLGVNGIDAGGTADRSGYEAYAVTVARLYGTPARWRAAQLVRFKHWGINTIGSYSDNAFQQTGMPYVVLLGLSHSGGVAGQPGDYWDPAWIAQAHQEIVDAVRQFGSDHEVIGYFLDSEASWGLGALGDLLDDYVAMPATSPGHRAVVAFLRSRYRSFAAFTRDFPVEVGSWGGLAGLHTLPGYDHGAVATRRAWDAAVATQFFSHTAPVLRALDRHHLDLGVGFIPEVTPSEVLRVSGRYVDVESFDWFPAQEKYLSLIAKYDRSHEAVPTAHTLAAFARISGRPLLISSFGYRAAGSGLPNTVPPFDLVLPNQAARAAATRNFLDCAIGTDYIVGAQWWEMTDEPASGRGDGENSNWGLVNEQDVEYTAVIKAFHDASQLARRRTTPGFVPPRCEPIEASAY